MNIQLAVEATLSLKIETIESSEILVPMYQTAWLHIQKDCDLNISAP
jgi:hypothetical protein